MSVFEAILLGVAMGAVFGFALEKSRVFEPGVILGQMRLRNFIMLRIFLTAVATGLVVLVALQGFGVVKLSPKATIYGADIVGGLLLGAGIALAGACPGTILAQLGAGYRDARRTMAGALAGTAAFILVEPTLTPVLLSGGPGKLTFNGLLDLPFAPVALVFAAVLIAGLFGLEKWRPWRSELGTRGDGVLPETRAKEPDATAAPAE